MTKFSDKKIDLVPASLKDYPTIQNMARFYVYDMSEYMEGEEGWEIPQDGLFECIDFKKYWENENAYPFIICVDHEIAGFAIIDKKGSHNEIDFNMAQFFILRRFKGKGIGRQVACKCFDNFKGTWEVMVLPKNIGAYKFWKKTISAYTHNHFQEYVKNVKHFNNSEKNIFKFESR